MTYILIILYLILVTICAVAQASLIGTDNKVKIETIFIFAILWPIILPAVSCIMLFTKGGRELLKKYRSIIGMHI